MPDKPAISALGAFVKALDEEKIRFILIGMMAAIEQGAPLMTVDYDFWVGTQVNVVFQPDGLRSFDTEYTAGRVTTLEGRSIRVLPLARVIASKRAAGREKDLVALPVLERTLRLSKRLLKGKMRKRSRQQ